MPSWRQRRRSGWVPVVADGMEYCTRCVINSQNSCQQHGREHTVTCAGCPAQAVGVPSLALGVPFRQCSFLTTPWNLSCYCLGPSTATRIDTYPFLQVFIFYTCAYTRAHIIFVYIRSVCIYAYFKVTDKEQTPHSLSSLPPNAQVSLVIPNTHISAAISFEINFFHPRGN